MSAPLTRREIKAKLMAIYRRLHRAHGHLNWWPGDSPLEIAVGAILTQNTAWANAAKAISQLKAHKALSYRALRELPLAQLAQLIRSSGYYNQKAAKLQRFVEFMEKHQGSLKRMARLPPHDLRLSLLEVNGIGKETADSILLYALHKPVFVVDAYTLRLFRRLGLLGKEISDQMNRAYDPIQALFMDHLPQNLDLYKDFHAQIVRTGHFYCRPKPRCEECPLKPVCPTGS